MVLVLSRDADPRRCHHLGASTAILGAAVCLIVTVLLGCGYYLARIVRSQPQGGVAAPPWGDVMLLASGALVMTLAVVIDWLAERRLEVSDIGFLLGGILVGAASVRE
jgi:Kef-type K+ transport system membrane component KefB